jgi:hypothetical protein
VARDVCRSNARDANSESGRSAVLRSQPLRTVRTGPLKMHPFPVEASALLGPFSVSETMSVVPGYKEGRAAMAMSDARKMESNECI